MTTAELNDQAWNAHPWTYRNNRGCANTTRGFIRYGIPEPNGRNEPDEAMKGGDRIGFTDVVITPDMVGSTVAVFTSIEIKGQGDRLKEGQKRWHNFILSHGGISEIWNDGEIIKTPIDINTPHETKATHETKDDQ